MDIFNRKKVARLEERINELEKELLVSDEAYGELEATVEMMDDEIRQVALSRYANKYVKIEYHPGTVTYFKVGDVTVDKGQVFFETTEFAKVDGDSILVHVGDTLMDEGITLSHFKTVGTVIKAAEYHEVRNKACDNA